VKVLLAAVLINTDHAALEHAVETLDGVGVDLVASAVGVPVLATVMVHSAVFGKVVAKLGIHRGLIGHDLAFAGDVVADDRDDRPFRDVFDMERTGRTATLNKGKNGVLVPGASADLETVLAANVGFIDLDSRTRAAHRRKRAVAQSFADAMSQKPRGFHAALKDALDLIGRDAFLAGAHQVNDLQPEMQG